MFNPNDLNFTFLNYYRSCECSSGPIKLFANLPNDLIIYISKYLENGYESDKMLSFILSSYGIPTRVRENYLLEIDVYFKYQGVIYIVIDKNFDWQLLNFHDDFMDEVYAEISGKRISASFTQRCYDNASFPTIPFKSSNLVRLFGLFGLMATTQASELTVREEGYDPILLVVVGVFIGITFYKALMYATTKLAKYVVHYSLILLFIPLKGINAMFTWINDKRVKHRDLNLVDEGVKPLVPIQVISKNVLEGTYNFVTADGRFGTTVVDISPIGITREMAIVGSDTSPSKEPIVGFVVVNDEEGASIRGTFFRVGNYLVTAYHVAEYYLFDYEGVELVGVTKKESNYDIDFSNLGSAKRFRVSDMSQFERRVPDKANEKLNAIIRLTTWGNTTRLGEDIYAAWLPDRFWSLIGLPSFTIGFALRKQIVKTTGYDIHKRCVVSAIGEVLSKGKHITYTSTTHKGWSGCPVASKRKVFAVHCGVGSTNVNNTFNEGESLGVVNLLLPKMKLESEHLVYDYNADDDSSWKFNGRQGKFDTYVVDGGEDTVVGWVFRHDRGEDYIGHKEDLYALIEDYYNDPAEAKEVFYSIVNGEKLTKKQKKLFGTSHDHEDGNIPLNLPSVNSGVLAEKIVVEPVIEMKPYMNIIGKTDNEYKVNFVRSVIAKPILRQEEISMAEELGADFDSYLNPRYSVENERNSYFKAMDRVVENKHQFNPNTKTVVLEMLKKLRYSPVENYKTASSIRSIIDSSRIQVKKSPGRRYKDCDMNTVGQVLKEVENLPDVVLQDWDLMKPLMYFNKVEPHKANKVASGLLRPIWGADIRDTLRNHAIFEGMLRSFSEKFMESPIMYAWSSSKPGDVNLLAKYLNLKNGEFVASSDKENWDSNFNGSLMRLSVGIMLKLATSEDRKFLKLWELDARKACNQVFRDSETVLSDGSSYTQKIYGIMKSGFVCTYILNCIGNLVAHVETMFLCGHTPDEILSDKFKLAISGDDALNKFPKGYDYENYFSKMKSFIKIKEIEHHPTLEGAEFCSNKFVKYNGTWGMVPVRFTKHMINLNNSDLETIQDTLTNLLNEYCFDVIRWDYMYSIAVRFASEGHFKIEDISSREFFVMRRLGLELAM